MGQYGDAIGDVEEGLAEIPGMLSETLTSAQRETDNVRELLNTNVQSSADASNQRLQDSLSKLSTTNNSVGNIQNVSNTIRRTLQQGIDNTIAEASDRFDIQSTRIQESKRASVDAIESMKAELEAKKKELEKEKKQAGIGAAVGVGSLLADAFLPGSGQILRTGYSQYASRT
jgi:copper chaperone CopZ